MIAHTFLCQALLHAQASSLGMYPPCLWGLAVQLKGCIAVGCRLPLLAKKQRHSLMQVPNGDLTAKQLTFLGDCIAPFGDRGCGDITTRANIQLRGMTLAEADGIATGLVEHGLSR